MKPIQQIDDKNIFTSQKLIPVIIFTNLLKQ